MSEPRLTIEMIPSTSWWDNARSRLLKGHWDALRKATYKAANYKCEICGGDGKAQGYHWSVECHEVWDYNPETKVQKLVRLIALCPKCHHVKHWGRTGLAGARQLQEAFLHLLTVNGWTSDQALDHIKAAQEQWVERSRIKWKLDLSGLR